MKLLEYSLSEFLLTTCVLVGDISNYCDQFWVVLRALDLFGAAPFTDFKFSLLDYSTFPKEQCWFRYVQSF